MLYPDPDPKDLTRAERARLGLEVLRILDGLSVVQVHIVLDEAKAMMNSNTRHDCGSTWFAQAAAEFRTLSD